MKRHLPTLAVSLFFLAACATAKPVTHPAAVDPVSDPTVIGSVDEAAREGSIGAAEGARTGRRVGRIVGVVAAVFGGPRVESVDDMVDRYRASRDVGELIGAAVGGSKGAKAGAKRGFQLDQQFAELHQIAGVEATRPYPDQIDVYLEHAPTEATLAAIAAVFAGREMRAIDIEGSDDAAEGLRDSLVDLGVPLLSIRTHRNDRIGGALMHIGYLD